VKDKTIEPRHISSIFKAARDACHNGGKIAQWFGGRHRHFVAGTGVALLAATQLPAAFAGIDGRFCRVALRGTA
jgi:hypothetical protein